MSKKQINNRLDELFDDIEVEEAATKKSSSSKEAARHPSKRVPKEKSASPSLPERLPIQTEVLVDSAQSVLMMPVKVDETSTMTLSIIDEAAREWDNEEKLLARQVVDQLELALQNARYFQETERRNAELDTLNQIISAASQSLELDKTLEQVLERTMTFWNLGAGLISMVNPATGELELSVWNNLPTIMVEGLQKNGLADTPCGYVHKTRAPLILEDFHRDKAPLDIKDLLKHGFVSYVGFPLVAARDEVVGTLCMFNKQPLSLEKDDIALLASIGSQVGFAIENARLFQETEQRTEELALVNRVVAEVSRSLNLKKNLSIIAKEVAKITSSLHVGIALLNEEKTHLVLTADYPLVEEDLGTHIPLENNLTTIEVLEKRQPLSIQDIPNNPLVVGIRDIMKQRGTESLAIFPVLSGEEAIGTVGVDFSEPFRTLSADQTNLVQTILLQASTAIETARLFQKAEDAAKALQEAHARVQTVLESTSVPTYINSFNESFLYANQALLNVLGMSLEELNSVDPANFYYAKEEREKYLTEIEKNQLVTDMEIRFVRGNGEVFWALVSSRVFEYEDAPAVLSTFVDITGRKKNEQILKRQNEYMAAAAEVGRLVTETLDMDILFRRAVNLLREYFGYYHAAIFTVEETGFYAVIQEATGEAGEEMKAREHSLEINTKSVVGTAASTGESFVVNDVRDNPNHRPNPLLPDTKAEAAIPLRTGTARRVIGALDLQATEINAFTPEDIAVLQILADQFATAIDNARSYQLSQEFLAEMREIDKLKSQFLANMSHELRTPLNSIIGFSRVILKGIDGPVTDLQQQDLTAIYNSGQHLLGLINDILDLSKIEAGKMELTFDEVDIEKLIKSVMSSVVGLIKDKPVHLEEEIEENLPLVKADSMRVRQILINLFSNAAKFTDEGVIKIVAKLEDQFVHITIIDSGPGIAKEDQKKLFRAFSQVDASATRATGGTGLGLSICQELVNMHGGEIDVDSDIGKGSAFHFTLPVYQEEIEIQVEEIEEALKEEEEEETPRPIIITIDDDEQVLNLYDRYLGAQGYQAIPITDPQRAHERVKAVQPYAITLDIMMPGYDGWQVLEKLKSDPETQQIPIVICSIVEDTQKGYALGAADYLLKPIIEDDLIGALNRIETSEGIRDILVVDDDPKDLHLVEKILKETGQYKPVLAQGGLAGWDKLNSAPPQAVILDLFMPEMDGFEIIDAMQATDALKGIPVIALSSGDLTSKQSEELNKLNHHLLQKGLLTPEELLSSLENSLKHFKRP